MKLWPAVLSLLLASGSIHANGKVWRPADGHTQMPLWPGTPPDARPVPGPETVALRTDPLVAGRPWSSATNITRPTLTLYGPKGKNNGAAVVVFPGGGFEVLAMDLEGTEACDWVTSIGATCVLVKYRVPSLPYDWHCNCRAHNYQTSTLALEDAQRAMGLVRLHASEWHINPKKIGVMGFSAGGYLVAEISTRFKARLYPAVDAADKQSARPDFVIAMYPGHLAVDHGNVLNPNVPVSSETPPTFIVQAEDDHTDGVIQALVYYRALSEAGVPAEMHLYAHGGHAFGFRPSGEAIGHWPELAQTWLRTIGVLTK
jgi:acetyl esterase/lipase